MGGANDDRYFSNSLAASGVTISYDRYGAYSYLSHTEYRYTSGSYKRCLQVTAWQNFSDTNFYSATLSGITTSLNNANARNPFTNEYINYELYFANN